MKHHLRQWKIFGSALALLMLVAIGMTMRRHIYDYIGTERWVTHTYDVILKLDQTYSLLRGMEAAQRGYEITNDKTFMAKYPQLITQVDSTLTQLRILTADNPIQQMNLNILEPLVVTKLAIMNKRQELITQKGSSSVTTQLTQQSQSAMKLIHKKIEQLNQEEVTLLAERQMRSKMASAYALRMVTFGGVACLILLVVIFYDLFLEIKKRTQAEMALQNQMLMRQSIIDSLGEGLVMADSNGKFIIFNPEAEKILGVGKTDATLQDWSKWFGSFQPDATTLLTAEELPLVKAMRGKSTDNMEIYIRNPKIPTGTFISVTGRPIRDTRGILQGGVVVFQDISKRKEAERELKRSQDKLMQSQKLEAMGRLAAGVAHEINNPLAVIMGFAESLVRRTAAGDPIEEPLKSIQREALRCKTLAQTLLTFSRSQDVQKQSMDLNAAVDAALSLVSAQAKMGRIRIETKLSEGLPQILANTNQIQQVVINLANNALDAMGTVGNLTVQTEIVQEDLRSWVCLSITDTGPGIAPEVLPNIFDPFFTTKPLGKGTGLGLSLVSEIVQKNSGRIKVNSRPGFTQFSVTLPIEISHSALETRAQAA